VRRDGVQQSGEQSERGPGDDLPRNKQTGKETGI
jgi:hypothetical protein